MCFRLAFRRYRAPFGLPVRTARGPWAEREGVIVRVEDGNGRVGWGEAAAIPWMGAENAEEDERVCRELEGAVSARSVEALPPGLACLRSALGAALLDASGEAAGGPREVLPVAALLPAGRRALEAARPKAEEGFSIFKWKVGVGDPADEWAILDDLCAELPPGGKLRLDANGAWDRRKAERWLDRCADRPIDYVEQPVAHDRRGAEDLLLGLAGDYPTPIGLDESLAGGASVERWLGAGWPGIYVVKPSLLGAPADSMTRLEAAGARVVFSSAFETAVGARSALRTAFGWKGESFALGFGVWPLFADPRFDGPRSAPTIRREDVERINPTAVWTALT